MTEADALLLRRLLDVYGQWFPSHVKDKELFAMVKRGMAEKLIGRYRAETVKHFDLFGRACRAGSVSHNENLGFVMEEFVTLVIDAENAETKRRLERALPQVSVAGIGEYTAKLARIQEAYFAGRITRGQRLSAIERLAREEGLPQDEVEAIVGPARESANKIPGGLDGTIEVRSAPMAERAEGAVEEANAVGVPTGGRDVEAG